MYMPRNAEILLFGANLNSTFLEEGDSDIVMLNFACIQL